MRVKGLEGESRKEEERMGPDCAPALHFASTHVDLTARQYTTWKVILFLPSRYKVLQRTHEALAKAYEVIFSPIDRWFDQAKKMKDSTQKCMNLHDLGTSRFLPLLRAASARREIRCAYAQKLDRGRKVERRERNFKEQQRSGKAF